MAGNKWTSEEGKGIGGEDNQQSPPGVAYNAPLHQQEPDLVNAPVSKKSSLVLDAHDVRKGREGLDHTRCYFN